MNERAVPLATRRWARAARRAVAAIEIGLVVLAIVGVVTGSMIAVAVWAACGLVYLVAGLVLLWTRLDSVAHRTRHRGRLDHLSWIPPIAASGAGVNSAVLVLTSSSSENSSTLTAMICAVAIITSWLLLHSGFADIYRSLQSRSNQPVFGFPDSPTPGDADFVYFAFTVGTSFATSDTSVLAPRARLIVIVHSIASFLYNALVVAIAFQVIQSLLKR